MSTIIEMVPLNALITSILTIAINSFIVFLNSYSLSIRGSKMLQKRIALFLIVGHGITAFFCLYPLINSVIEFELKVISLYDLKM